MALLVTSQVVQFHLPMILRKVIAFVARKNQNCLFIYLYEFNNIKFLKIFFLKAHFITYQSCASYRTINSAMQKSHHHACLITHTGCCKIKNKKISHTRALIIISQIQIASSCILFQNKSVYVTIFFQIIIRIT